MSAPTVESGLPTSGVPAQIPAPEGAGTPNYTVRPKISDSGAVEGELLEVSMGPQHPSTHGRRRFAWTSFLMASRW